MINMSEFFVMKEKNLFVSHTGLVSSGDILTSWGEGASLAWVGDPSSDGIMIKVHYGVDVLHRPASHPIFSYWLKLNLALLLDQLRLA